MKRKLAGILADLKADYADIRHEENHKTRIIFQGKMLSELTSYSTDGGHLRAYADGGTAIATFSSLDSLERLARSSVASARLAGARRDRPLRLKPAPAIVGSFPVSPSEDPRAVSLEEKLELAERYNALLLSAPHVVTTTLLYDEFHSKRLFVNADGSHVEYEVLNVGIRGAIVAKKGAVQQQVSFAVGGNEDFAPLRNREEDLRFRLDIAKQLIEAEPARAGVFPVILDPDETGVFIHEAFGHLSEADELQNNPSFREKLRMGTVLGRPILNVTDDPTIRSLPGSFVIDDEGVMGARTRLITEGVLTGRLHSRETAAAFDEPMSGNAIAVDAGYTPLVRMSNVFIEGGESSLDDMIASVDDGYYLVGGKGGQTSGDQFTFGAQCGYRIRDGKLGPMVRDINMSGELFDTLGAISMIGRDVKFRERGGCGKGDPVQISLKSGMGGPHIKIDQVTVGGV